MQCTICLRNSFGFFLQIHFATLNENKKLNKKFLSFFLHNVQTNFRKFFLYYFCKTNLSAKHFCNNVLEIDNFLQIFACEAASKERLANPNFWENESLWTNI